MSEAKNAILHRLRAGLGREALPKESKEALKKTLAAPAKNIVPHRVRLAPFELAEEFIRMTTGEATTVSEAKECHEIPEAVASFLRSHDLPSAVVLAPDEAMVRLPWDQWHVHVRPGRAEENDLTSVTPAFAGIAETGCFMLISGSQTPYTLNFLPENQIVVLERRRIVATPEDAFGLLRKKFGRNMPRTALMAAGPSRSADIGTSLQFGAHGPRRLHCILLGK